jgi:phage repressor protein C with HTH and peptisase S24 domain
MRFKAITRPILVRRVRGGSMAPKIRPGQLIVATSLFRRLHPGQVVIIRRGSRELVKRIERIKADQLFVIGDNLEVGSDSRQFGWLDRQAVVARVFHPNPSK